MNRTFPTLSARRGFTLLETVVWVTITAMILASIISSVLYFYRTNNYAVEQAAAITSAQRGIDDMMQTMREAVYASNGAYPIVSMSENEIIFYADIDDDQYVERLRYYLEGGSLKRGTVEPSGDPPAYTNPESVSSISDFVRNIEQGVPAFRFYDEDGNLMTDLTDVTSLRFIEATIVVNINPNRLPNQFTLRSTSSFRNLK